MTENGRQAPWRAAALVACLGIVMSLPALSLPFLSDDWAHVGGLTRETPLATPFGYSRPLLKATLWIDWWLWGASGPMFHLANVLLAGAAAGLVVVVGARLTGDPRLALLAGVLFALHPSHVETVAWVAARADALCCVLVLLAALAWERWRERIRGLPLTTLVLFALALGAKETAVVLPAVLLLIEWCHRRKIGVVVVLRGFVPLVALAVSYFLVVWPLGQTRGPLAALRPLGRHTVGVLADFASAAILPARTEIIENHPFAWLAAASVVAGGLAVLASFGKRRLPATAAAAVPAFVILLGPSLISFQDRFLFLPTVALSVGLAALLRAAGSRARVVAGLALVAMWLPFTAERWSGWLEAGRASRRLVGALTAESLRPDTGMIFVVNMPHRVAGAPVLADFRRAIALSGGRPVDVEYAALIDYPCADAETLAGPADQAILTTPKAAEIALLVPPGLFCRVVWSASGSMEGGVDTVIAGVNGHVSVHVPRLGRDKPTFVWTAGHLQAVF